MGVCVEEVDEVDENVYVSTGKGCKTAVSGVVHSIKEMRVVLFYEWMKAMVRV